MKYRLVLKKPRAWGAWKGTPRVLVAALWIGGGGVLVGVVFVLSFYLAMRVEMRSTEVRVPDLAGLTLQAASERVEPLELVLDVVEQRHNATVASGRVLQQMPPAEAAVRRGRKVKLILSLGGRVLEVPDLAGEASRAVEIELRQEGFIPGDEATVPFAAVPRGRIVAQVPPSGTPAVPNTRVHRLVSSGAPAVTWVMPDLTGLGRRTAEEWLTGNGFRRGAVRQVRMGGRAPGTVVGQLPLAGYPVRANDIVELTVAR
jgi:serine/threonine-protein kinase